IALLEFKVAKWLNTRWFPNSNMPGKDVSCQKLVDAIYREVGFGDIPVPEMRMSARGLKESLVEKFMEGRAEFERAPIDAQLWPGDLLNFRCYDVCHHLGILICARQRLFVHVEFKARVRLCSLNDTLPKSNLMAV